MKSVDAMNKWSKSSTVKPKLARKVVGEKGEGEMGKVKLKTSSSITLIDMGSG